MDIGYKAQYDTSIPADQIIQEIFSIKLFSNVKFSVSFSFFGHYKFDIDFNSNPLEITPLKMYLYYTNLIAIARY